MSVPFFRRAQPRLASARRAAAILLDILFPSCCLSCGADTTVTRAVLCQACLDSISVRSAFFCPVCLGRIPDPNIRCHPDAKFLAGAAVSYDEPTVKELVRVLKYKGVREAAKPLGTFVARHLELALPARYREGAIIVPVPLSRARERIRGYNQAEEIARITAEILGLPLELRLLLRTRNTKPQTEIKGREQRLLNLKGSFTTEGDAMGRIVILVDDVYTTGATMREAAETLKAAGARRVIAVAAARA
ncbi:MAG: phosphoribosyltransferase family protein [bacterium]|nr:phosphoribosyltransferase family protein [bacterium]